MTDLLDRLADKVLIGDGCWPWTGSRQTAGYGTIRIDGKTQLAHRVTYELFKGPIPEGLTLDHLCRVRECVRPDHLEPVTMLENYRRGTAGGHHFAATVEAKRLLTECKHGHPFDELNTYWRNGRRTCRACNREAQRRRYRRRLT